LKATQIVQETGPDTSLQTVELPDPDAATAGDGVLVEVHAAGVSFPELLQTRGLYQLKPPLPFVPGSEVAGTVRSAPDGLALAPGDRVLAFCGLGGFAELAIGMPHLTFPLSPRLTFAQGAGFVLNYHTAYFALVVRGRLRAGETVLVHGAAGGVGTACLQVAKALGARTVALVSTEGKRQTALHAGADEALIADADWKEQVKQLSNGGVDLVLDPVGGDRFLDSLRCLREGGRHVVVGFTGGGIPELRVNRLLLNNIEVIGAGWGAYALSKPELCREIQDALTPMIEDGAVAPIVGASFPLAGAAEAIKSLEDREAVGKVVLQVRPD
jgi:NADPH2:quinone reductase